MGNSDIKWFPFLLGSPWNPFKDPNLEVELGGYSHHTGKASLQCGSSCAHPAPFSDWRPCYTHCIYTASPAMTHRQTPDLKRAQHLTSESQTSITWYIHSVSAYGQNLEEGFGSVVFKAAHKHNTHTQTQTRRQWKTREHVEIFLLHTSTHSHWYPLTSHPSVLPGSLWR